MHGGPTACAATHRACVMPQRTKHARSAAAAKPRPRHRTLAVQPSVTPPTGLWPWIALLGKPPSPAPHIRPAWSTLTPGRTLEHWLPLRTASVHRDRTKVGVNAVRTCLQAVTLRVVWHQTSALLAASSAQALDSGIQPTPACRRFISADMRQGASPGTVHRARRLQSPSVRSPALLSPIHRSPDLPPQALQFTPSKRRLRFCANASATVRAAVLHGVLLVLHPVHHPTSRCRRPCVPLWPCMTMRCGVVWCATSSDMPQPGLDSGTSAYCSPERLTSAIATPDTARKLRRLLSPGEDLGLGSYGCSTKLRSSGFGSGLSPSSLFVSPSSYQPFFSPAAGRDGSSDLAAAAARASSAAAGGTTRQRTHKRRLVRAVRRPQRGRFSTPGTHHADD